MKLVSFKNILKIFVIVNILVLVSFAQSQPKQVTHAKGGRLLAYENSNGKFICKVFDAYHSIPRFKDGFFKFSLRTKLKLRNLFILRNSEDKSMVGPLEYFGTLTSPEKFAYQINMEGQYPVIFRYPANAVYEEQRPPIDPDFITQIQAKWLSGLDPQYVEELKYYPKPTQESSSLVKASGVFEIDAEQLSLKAFDATAFDLSPFGARMVKNDQPFSILKEKEDPMEAVTYLFNEHYATTQVKNQVGLFLETHGFSQTMTPLAKDCAGYVMLARCQDDTETYEVIAVQIPYGYTLIVSKGAIHGDTTLKGKYMMCMTANHKTMATADVVFLKSRHTKENLSVELLNSKESTESLSKSDEAVLYYENNDKEKSAAFYSKINKEAKARLRSSTLLPLLAVDKASLKFGAQWFLHNAKQMINI